MTDHTDWDTDFGDIEEMIRAAGGYVEVSDDLRPRTLEEARDASRETSTRSGIAGLIAVVAILVLQAGQVPPPPPAQAGIRSDADQLFAAAGQTTASANFDLNWSLVDAYRELRRRQASLIEDAF